MSSLFYRDFEERFRGPSDLIKERLKVYLPFLLPLKMLADDFPQALDLGCGRGEWLTLLKEQGFQVQGVDQDAGMLLACRQLDLNVTEGDALNYIKNLAAESLSVVSAFHVIEHVPFNIVCELVSEALRVLKPGGLLILETPNSENLTVGTSTFYLDPSHQRPLPAPLVAFLAEYSGFKRVKTLFLQESSSLATAHAIGLHTVFEGVSPDYAIVAQKKLESSTEKLFDVPFGLEYGVCLSALAGRYDRQLESRFQRQEMELAVLNHKIEQFRRDRSYSISATVIRLARYIIRQLFVWTTRSIRANSRIKTCVSTLLAKYPRLNRQLRRVAK